MRPWVLRAWVVRGAALAVVHACADTAVASATASDPVGQGWLRALVLALLVGAAAGWAAVDGWRDLPDRGMTWLAASLLAGVAGAVLGVVGRAVFVDRTGVSALGEALTGGAAFTALLVLLPAGLGLLVGRTLIRGRGTQAES